MYCYHVGPELQSPSWSCFLTYTGGSAAQTGSTVQLGARALLSPWFTQFGVAMGKGSWKALDTGEFVPHEESGGAHGQPQPTGEVLTGFSLAL